MDRQARFIDKLEKLDKTECLAKCVWNLCQELDYAKYYVELSTTNYDDDVKERTSHILEKVPSQKLLRPNPTVGFGRIWSDLVRFGRIWSD